MFQKDENNKFTISFADTTVIYLDSIIKAIKSLSLNLNEEKSFEIKDIHDKLISADKIEVKRTSNTEFTLNFKYIKYGDEYIQKVFLYKPLILKTSEDSQEKGYDIYSNSQVKCLIKDLNFQDVYYFIEEKEEKNIDLKDFPLYSGKIIKIKFDYYNLHKKIFERKKSDTRTLSSLTLNFDLMFKQEERDDIIYEGNGRLELYKELNQIYNSDDEKFKYYCGISGIGKTVSLLNFRYNKRKILYLNMQILFKIKCTMNEFYQRLKNELIYVFDEEEEYKEFVNKKENFPEALGNYEFIKFGFNLFKNFIGNLIKYFNANGHIFMVIIDQYKKKYDEYFSLTDNLEMFSQNNKLFKFICCSSTNEKDVKERIFNSLFNKNLKLNNYISLQNLITIKIDILTENQKKVFEIFGNTPKYFSRIKRCKDEDLEKLEEIIKIEICDEINKSIKKLEIENYVVYGLLLVIKNIGKDITKLQLKNLFKFIFLKFITINPKYKNESFIDYSKLTEDFFVLNYSFPILKDIFKIILKTYKKEEYKQRLIDCNNAEEGYILEHLIYLSLEPDENHFEEQLVIDKSYQIDQLYQCSKLYTNTINDKQINNIDNKFIDNLFEEGKNYHLFQHNENGPIFDGGLLISNIKKKKKKKKKKMFQFNCLSSNKKKK